MTITSITARLRNVSVSDKALRVISASFMPLLALVLIVGVGVSGLLDRFLTASPEDQKNVLLGTGLCGVALWLFVNFANRFGGDGQTSPVQTAHCACGVRDLLVEELDEFYPLRAELGYEAVEIAIVRSPRGSAPHVVEQLARQIKSMQSVAPSDIEQIARHESAHAVASWALGGTVYQAVVNPEEDSGYIQTVFPVETPQHDRLWFEMVVYIAGNAVDRSHGVRRDSAWSDFNSVLNFAAQLLSIGLFPSGFDGPLATDALVLAATQRAHDLLSEHEELVERLTAALLLRNKLDGHDVLELLEGHPGVP